MFEQSELEMPEAIYKEQMDLLLLRAGMLKKVGNELISSFVSESLNKSDSILFTEFLKENPEQLADVKEYGQFFNACSAVQELLRTKVIIPIPIFNRTSGVKIGKLAAYTEKESDDWEELAPKSFVFEINQYIASNYPNDGIVEKLRDCDLSEYTDQSVFLIHTKKSLFLSLLKMSDTKRASIKIEGDDIERVLVSEEIELFRVMSVEELKWLKILKLEVNGKTVIIQLG